MFHIAFHVYPISDTGSILLVAVLFHLVVTRSRDCLRVNREVTVNGNSAVTTTPAKGHLILNRLSSL